MPRSAIHASASVDGVGVDQLRRDALFIRRDRLYCLSSNSGQFKGGRPLCCSSCSWNSLSFIIEE
jgi:hypothetical protein